MIEVKERIIKALYSICFLVVCAIAFDLEVDYGLENNARFSIITLRHSKAFPCKENRNIEGKLTLIECVISGTPHSSFPKSKTEFFEIYTAIKDNIFHLFIKANKNQSLFANFLDLKSDVAIPKERPKDSKIWQIVGYDNDIPFLSNKTYSHGLNFPIQIPNSSLPTINELNMDSSPLVIDAGADWGLFLEVRTAYNAKKYDEVINLVDTILQSYHNSIFQRDLLLYKIRAMYYSDIMPDDILDSAKEWVKIYATDNNVPEVLFMIADSYSKLRIYKEARYYFDRILSEYEDSKYTQYALVGIAKNLAINGDRRHPEILFAKAYEEAKDKDTASYVAYHWGMYEMKNDKIANANDLFLRIVNANPAYFLKDKAQSYETLKTWVESKLYNTAAMAGDSMLPYLEMDNFKEQLMFDVGLWYEMAQNPKEAHRINAEFLEIFKDSPHISVVKQRDDNLLFALDSSDLEANIKQYDYLIATYPNTPNAKIAYEKKAQALFDLGRYDEVIALKNYLPSDNNLPKNAYIYLIEHSKMCDDILKYYLDSAMILATKNAPKVFECLFQASLFNDASQLSLAMLGNISSGRDNLTWLYNEARASYALRDFLKSRKASQDAFNLAKHFKQKQDSGIILFLSLANLNRKDEALSVFDELTKIFPSDIKMLEVYDKLFAWAIDSSDNIALESYAKEILRLQHQFDVFTYSPFVELRYADMLFADHRYTQMLDVLSDVANLNNTERAKVSYLRGSAYYELGEMAKARGEFRQCIASSDMSFKNLCTQAMELLQNQ